MAEELSKFQVHHDRHEGVSFEDFVQFVEKQWLPVALPIMKSHGVVRFSITFSKPEERAALSAQVAAANLGEGLVVSDYDSVSTYYVRDRSSLFAMQASPEWREGPAKLQEPWVTLSPGLFVIGQEQSFDL